MIEPRSLDLLPWPMAMAAFRRVWQERDDLLRLAAVPVVIVFLMYLWFQRAAEELLHAIPPGQQPDAATIQALQVPFLLYALGSWCVTVVFSANWMRVLMLGGNAVQGLGLALSRRHLRLLALSLGLQIGASILLSIVLLIIALILPVPALTFAVMILFVIWYVIAVVRLCPVWVGISIDAPLKLRAAWKRTDGFGIKLAVALVMVSFVLLMLQFLLFTVSMSLGVTEAAPLALSFIAVVIQFIMFAAIGAVFVLAYPRFVSETV
jgi:hypothetical protein